MTFKGTYTALVTPFNKDLTIDEKALEALVEFQIEQGISGLVPMGTTGESPTLNHDEHLRIIEIVVKKSGGRVPVIAGTGSNCTDEAIEYTKIAREIGVDATLQVAPYYNKPTQEGFYRHFSSIADTVDIPMMVYNIPGRSGANIDTHTLLRLSKHPNIAAVKEASGSFAQIMDLIANKPDDFDILSGDDNIAVPMTLMGGSGLISVASNSIPKKMSNLVQLALNGKVAEANKMHYELLPFFKAMFIETNPIPIKYVLWKQGLIECTYRLPLCEMSGEHKASMESLLSSFSF